MAVRVRWMLGCLSLSFICMHALAKAVVTSQICFGAVTVRHLTAASWVPFDPLAGNDWHLCGVVCPQPRIKGSIINGSGLSVPQLRQRKQWPLSLWIEWCVLSRDIMHTKHCIAMEHSTLTNFCVRWRHMLKFTVSINGLIQIAFYLNQVFLCVKACSLVIAYGLWVIHCARLCRYFSQAHSSSTLMRLTERKRMVWHIDSKTAHRHGM
jgi:hypothetical protein